MAPVIRVTDDVFRRLQAVSEPLVDTPSRVIEKLLTHYETSVADIGDRTPLRSDVGSARAALASAPRGDQPNLFLAPARRANLEESLERPVKLDFARRYLTPQQLDELRQALSGKDEFYCWAASEGKQTYFEAMRPGDYVFFTETGTGRFTYLGRVATRLISEPLGEALWPDVPGLPWKFIYVLDQVRRIDLKKDRFLSRFGYNESYPVYGFIRITPDRVRRVLASFGTVDDLIRDSE